MATRMNWIPYYQVEKKTDLSKLQVIKIGMFRVKKFFNNNNRYNTIPLKYKETNYRPHQ